MKTVAMKTKYNPLATAFTSVAVLCAMTMLCRTALAAVGSSQDTSGWVEHRVAKRVIARIEARLNLTDQQREQAKTILKTEEPAILALAQSARQEREEMAAMSTFDQTQAEAVAQKYGATNAAIVVERAKVRLELRAVLNDAQRQQLEQLRARFGSHADERFGELIDLL